MLNMVAKGSCALVIVDKRCNALVSPVDEIVENGLIVAHL